MTDDRKTLELAAGIVAAYVGNNVLPVRDVPDLIRATMQALASVGSAESAAMAAVAPKATASQIRKSITPDALISFEDGKPYKTLKRHLSVLGLSVEAYKAKWGLPADYPTTAANYSAVRSEMARSLGLGAGNKRRGGRARSAKA
ncbi:MucR family transcriptional regulator [Caulobacter sp.]|uniref:MucR family transcriptional regulator n=1 Tax=Caulobacter sp. TaxID=78 RepID=UPI0025C25A5B|nr:MucR family transcriptional regulator [Caulobacter sp.]